MQCSRALCLSPYSPLSRARANRGFKLRRQGQVLPVGTSTGSPTHHLGLIVEFVDWLVFRRKPSSCSYSNVILGIVSPLFTATQSTLLPSVFVAHKKKVISCLGSRPMICSTCIGKQQESALKIREVRASWLEQSLGDRMCSPR